MCKYKLKNKGKNYPAYELNSDLEYENIYKDPRYFIQVTKKIKKPIFTILKVGKIGRRKKINKQKNRYSNVRHHNKLSDDNIIRKLKRYFTRSLLDFVNKLYEMEEKELESQKIIKHKKRKKQKWLKIIQSKIIAQIKKRENLIWLDNTIKDYLSSEVSEKCKNYDTNYNKIQIEQIYQENLMSNLLKFMKEKNIRYMFEIYAKDGNFGIRVGKWYLNFLTLKYDMNQMINEDKDEKEDFNKENTDIENYSSKIKEIAINFEEIFKNKRERKKNEITKET